MKIKLGELTAIDKILITEGVCGKTQFKMDSELLENREIVNIKDISYHWQFLFKNAQIGHSGITVMSVPVYDYTLNSAIKQTDNATANQGSPGRPASVSTMDSPAHIVR